MMKDTPQPRARYYDAAPPRRGPEAVDDVLASVIERHGGRSGLAGARVLEEWATWGGEWSERATAVSLKDGILVLEARTGADATLLRYDEGAIRAAIVARVGPGIVHRITVRVASGRARR